MFIFGHTGITIGTALVISGMAAATHRPDDLKVKQLKSNSRPAEIEKEKGKQSFWVEGLEYLSNFMDIRLLAVGSMLPDIIDKPLGMILSESGRTYTHTLIITLIACGLGLYLYKWGKKVWFLTLSMGMISHLVLDQMWQTPHTLLWPLSGWTFPRVSEAHWLKEWLFTLVHNPEVYISEAVGLVVLASVSILLIRRHKFMKLFLHGKVQSDK